MEHNTTPHIQLDKYSGPLDLLLQLIQKQEMDIRNIDICKITRQYLQYLKTVSTPDLEHAGEFITMASLLMYIKSNTLLPLEEKDKEEEENPEELKEKLTQLLVAYQKFQTLSKILFQRHWLGRDSWASGTQEKIQTALPSDEIEINRDKAPLLLVKNYQKALMRKHKHQPHVTPPPLPSLISRIQAITESFVKDTQVPFSQLVKVRQNKHSLLLTFLSLLELSKLEFISLFQMQPFSDIMVKVNKALDENAFARLHQEELDWRQINEIPQTVEAKTI